MNEILPLDILKEKYIPIENFPEEYGISLDIIKNLIAQHKLKYTEFKVPGAIRRTVHVNPEDLFRVLKEEK